MTRPRKTALARYREALDEIAMYIVPFRPHGDGEACVKLKTVEHLRDLARQAISGKGER